MSDASPTRRAGSTAGGRAAVAPAAPPGGSRRRAVSARDRVLLAAVVFATACAGAWDPEPARRAARAYDARIVRDSFGVPSIYGARDADVAFGVAYANAEDDFPTLQEVIATSRIRAGALLGPAGAPLDYAMHLLRVREDVEARARREIDGATWALLEGYAAGLNAYAADHPDEVAGVVRDLLPVVPEDIVAGFVLRSPFFYGFDQVLARLVGGRPIPGTWDDKGSNAFAVAPRRSGDGTTRLLSNSHQPWTGPVAWYELRVHSREGLHFAGATFPGSPVPFLGHNATLGWTNTVNKPDLVDVYRLRLRPGDDDQYWYDGAWRPLERRRVWLSVKLGPLRLPVPKTVLRSVHGPVIRNDSGTFAVRYAGMGDVRQVMQYHRLVRARTWDEWRAAMRLQAVPATNFVYADATGRIAYVYNGRFPRRAPGADRERIRRGDTSAVVWTDVVPFDAIPQLVDPPSGWLFNANNTPFVATTASDNLRPQDWPAWMGIERAAMTNRAWRAVALLDTAPRITRDVLLRAKFDARYQLDRGWPRRAMEAIRAADTTRDPDVAEARRLMLAWNGEVRRGEPAAALGALVMWEWVRPWLAREADPPADSALAAAASWLRRHHGTLTPPLEAVLDVRRGTASAPVDGGTDLLRAFYGPRDDAAGRVHGAGGDSFIMLVEWGADGRVASQSIQPFGAAIGRPGSPHHADQLALFARGGWKPVPWDTLGPPPDPRGADRPAARAPYRAGGENSPR